MKILDVPRSGSYQGITSSRNRNGQYVRSRVMPVNRRTAQQIAVRTHQTTNAAAWRSLTSTQRAGWESLGAGMQRSDRLGQSYTLTGIQAHNSINNVLALASTTLLADAPAMLTPAGIATCTPTISHTVFSVAWTVTPAPAGVKVILRASPQRSPGRNFEADFRVITVTAAAAASPTDLFALYSARFGTPVVGNKIFVSIATTISGFESVSLVVAAIVA